MSNFPGRGLKVAISRIPQTNYATATTAAANAFVQEIIKNRGVAEIVPQQRSNRGYATGLGFASESWVEAWQTRWPWTMDMSAENVGRYLLALMGKVTTTTPDEAENPDVRQHIFEPLPFLTTSQLPAFSGVAQLLPGANGINELIPSMVARSGGLRSSGLAMLEGSVEWAGSGKRTRPSGVTWSTHVNEIAGTQNYFYSKQNELIISDTDGSNASNRKCDILSSSFDVANSLADDDYGCPAFVDDDPAKGAIRAQHLLLEQVYSLGYNLKMGNDDPETEALLDQAPVKIVQKWEGGVIPGGDGSMNYLLEITASLAKYAAVGRDIGDGFTNVTVTPELLWSTAASKIVEVKLINKVTSYTT